MCNIVGIAILQVCEVNYFHISQNYTYNLHEV